MGMKEMLDKLIADAGMPDNEIAVRELLERMEKIDLEVLKAASDQFKELCEAWLSDVTKSEDKAYICIRLAELSIVDTPEFRECLHAAIRKVLPPYLTSGSVIKAIGAKDPATSVHDAAMRLRKLQQLRSMALILFFRQHIEIFNQAFLQRNHAHCSVSLPKHKQGLASFHLLLQISRLRFRRMLGNKGG